MQVNYYFHLKAVWTVIHSFLLANRQNLINARAYANLGIVLVEVNNEEAVLRSATELQQTGTLRKSVPYRDFCAYTFADGKLSLQEVISPGVQNRVGFTSVVDTRKNYLCCYVIIMNNFTVNYSVCVL